MENDKLKVKVNGNGSIDVLYKETGKEYRNLNYLTSQGEIGNAWNHKAPEFDRKYNTMGNNAKIYVTESGELTGTVVCEYDFELPESCEVNPSSIYRKLPVKIAYTLDDGADFVKVKIELDNTIKDHWLRANFPTDIETDVSIADSHFDIVKRNIEIPDSKGWVEQAFGTHPLRTFVTVTDGENGLAVMPKGLFEYEVFDDKTIALTLIRACRIKLAVSEEKITELPDDGVQCPGRQEFEYAIQFHTGNYNELACAVGGQNVKTYDALSGIKSWQETLDMIPNWEKNKLTPEGDYWKYDSEKAVWVGEKDKVEVVKK